MSGWKPIATAPLDGRDVLLFTTGNGIAEARFCPGEWSHGVEGSEYEGPVWSCCDDAFQIEIEECAANEYYHGQATHWMPTMPDPPVSL